MSHHHHHHHFVNQMFSQDHQYQMIIFLPRTSHRLIQHFFLSSNSTVMITVLPLPPLWPPTQAEVIIVHITWVPTRQQGISSKSIPTPQWLWFGQILVSQGGSSVRTPQGVRPSSLPPRKPFLLSSPRLLLSVLSLHGETPCRSCVRLPASKNRGSTSACMSGHKQADDVLVSRECTDKRYWKVHCLI